jgi:uncharacterized membrane protein
MSVVTSTLRHKRTLAVLANRWAYGLTRHWLLIVNILLGLYAGLPWLAPVFMKFGWGSAGGVIYLIYSTQCHQLPERSFFLFGAQPMYSLAQIHAVWQNTPNPFILRQFIGTPEMGWKVAWSDRMVSLFGSLFTIGLAYALLRKKLKPLPLWGFALLALPMALDGGTHLVSDMAGIGQGFRDSNVWLAILTQHVFPATFYAGDALGSFNSWMRLITGVLVGLGAVWTVFPLIQASFAEANSELEAKFELADGLISSEPAGG